MSKRYRTRIRTALRAASRPEERLLGEAVQQGIAFCTFLLVAGLSFFAATEGRLLRGFIVGWNVAAVVYLGLEVLYILRGTPEQTKHWAKSQTSGRPKRVATAVWRALSIGSLSAATIVGLVTAVNLLQQSDVLLRLLGGSTVILVWLIVQANYGSYYAYLYYRTDPAGGLTFPGNKEPGLVDFNYFALTIGTAFSVSDVEVTTTGIRQVIIGHCLLSFAYNAAILTLAFGAVLGAAGR